MKYVRYRVFSLRRCQCSLTNHDERNPWLFVAVFCLGLCSPATSLVPLIRTGRYHTRTNATQMRWTSWSIRTYMKATYFCIFPIYPHLVKTSDLLKGTSFVFHKRQVQELGTANICADSKDGTTPVNRKPDAHTGVQTADAIKAAVLITGTAVAISWTTRAVQQRNRAGVRRFHKHYSANFLQIRLKAFVICNRGVGWEK